MLLDAQPLWLASLGEKCGSGPRPARGVADAAGVSRVEHQRGVVGFGDRLDWDVRSPTACIRNCMCRQEPRRLPEHSLGR
jgi:hypothetical protein